ncbi:MAG: glucokinase, partial [Candidatus Binatota bacterium]|nr:glucokinase [Candidatus Binatota bacterium]
MARLVLAGDIGGTKTNLAIYAVGDGGRPSAVREASFASREYAGLEDVLAAFLRPGAERVTTAAFGIAGPVFENVVVTTNLPWVVEADRIASALGGARVRLLNDLEATAYGALFLPPAELHV